MCFFLCDSSSTVHWIIERDSLTSCPTDTMLVGVFNFWRGLDEGDDWCNWCVWAPLGCNNSKFSQIMCIICFIFHITQVKFLKLFLTLHTPVSSKKGKVFLVSHSDKVISELFGYQSRLLWYRWLCVRAHDVGWKKKENLVVNPEHWSSKCCWGIETSWKETAIPWPSLGQPQSFGNA